MRRRRLIVGTIAAFLVAAGSPPAGAITADTATTSGAGPAMAETGRQATRLLAGGPSASTDMLDNVPDDQVVCEVDGWKPTWSPKPTVNFGLRMQCDGRWVSGTAHLYLYYRFSESDSWTLDNRQEFIPLPGGDSSTVVMRGISHTLNPCFPAYWYGQVYVEATFYAGDPLTDWAWFGTTPPDPFLSC